VHARRLGCLPVAHRSAELYDEIGGNPLIPGRRIRATILSVLTRDDIARLHDEENRAEFALRRRESEMQAEEREMERAIRAFEEDADQAKRFVTAEWRREHWGHEPEHPPDWEVSGAAARPRRR
jgi:hypothetical protein